MYISQNIKIILSLKCVTHTQITLSMKLLFNPTLFMLLIRHCCISDEFPEIVGTPFETQTDHQVGLLYYTMLYEQS